MIRDRILQYIDSKGISRYKFYQITNLSNGFLDKDGAIGSDKCEIILSHFPDLSPRWLITGEGNMIYTDEQEPTVYKTLFEQKEKEIRELNREIGKLNYKIELLIKGNDSSTLSMVADQDTSYKATKKK